MHGFPSPPWTWAAGKGGAGLPTWQRGGGHLAVPGLGFWEPPGRGRMRARHLPGKGRKGEVGVALRCAYLAARVWPAPFRVQKGGQNEGGSLFQSEGSRHSLGVNPRPSKDKVVVIISSVNWVGFGMDVSRTHLHPNFIPFFIPYFNISIRFWMTI